MRLALLLALLAPARAFAFRVEKIRRAGVLGGAPVTIDVAAEEAMVKFSSGTDHAAALARIGATVGREYPEIGWTWVKLAPGTRVLDGLGRLMALPEVVAAHANHIHYPNKVPNDAMVNQQTNLSQINAFSAWEYETGVSSPVTIAMIDSGIEGTHPDLSGKFLNAPPPASVQSQDCSGGACVPDIGPTSYCSHGTQTAGVAAAAGNNGIGIAGLSWGAKLVSLKVVTGGVGCAPAGDCNACGAGASDNALVAALIYAKNMQTAPGTPLAGKIVVNISLGASNTVCNATNDGTPLGPAAGSVFDAMQQAVNAGVPVVVSAGNGGPVNQPANCAGANTNTFGIIPVGSVDQKNNISSFSSRGPELAGYGVVAPGENIETTFPGAAYTGAASGTSFSAPHVAGLAALILSARPDCRGMNCAQYVQNMIRGGADQIGQSPTAQGAGRIDAFRSVRLAVNGTLADFTGDQKAIAFPNPFRISQIGSVAISIPVNLQSSNASTRIYTVAGQLVRTLTGLTWDGRNDSGSLVASGTYIFEVKTDAGNSVGRLAVIR